MYMYMYMCFCWQPTRVHGDTTNPDRGDREKEGKEEKAGGSDAMQRMNEGGDVRCCLSV